MLPDLESLRCFQAAAVRLNFRAAAKFVGLSPAAFSDRIGKLESQLGVPLFIRTTRRVRLSPQGEKLLPQANQVLAEAQRCLDAVGDGTPAPYELRLGTRWELGMSWVLPAIQRLERSTPEQQLHLAFGNGAPLLERLMRGQIDAVIGSMRITSGKLSYVPLHEETYCLVGNPRTLQNHAFECPEDAVNHTLVDTHEAFVLFRYWLDQAPRQESWIFGKTRFLGTIAAIRQWVIEEDGLAVLPTYFVSEQLKSGELIEVMPSIIPRSDWFRLIWLKDHPREQELRTLAKELSQIPLS
jgi:DNA-binding transcriptional LysR family regulator